jgi:soluble lytic murein transglycosylase-like protein
MRLRQNPALLAILLAASSCYAADGIVPVRANGRVIFVNNDAARAPTTAPAPEFARAQTPVTEATPARLVYWSHTRHRWVPVPRANAVTMRNARSAMREVAQYVASSPDTGIAPSQPVNVAPDTSALTRGHMVSQADLDSAIDAAAARHSVDPNLVRAIIKVESNFNPHAVSRKGAIGLMQLMPGTARQLNVHNPYDVAQNLDGGIRHFKGLMENFGGDLALSLAAYNAGEGAVARNRGVPPYAETRAYVKRITSLYGEAGSGTQSSGNIRRKRDANGHWVFTNE